MKIIFIITLSLFSIHLYSQTSIDTFFYNNACDLVDQTESTDIKVVSIYDTIIIEKYYTPDWKIFMMIQLKLYDTMNHETVTIYKKTGEVEFIESRINGKSNGYTTWFRKNGNKRVKIHYLNNEINGRCIYYRRNGQPKKMFIIKNGERIYPYYRWSKDGEKFKIEPVTVRKNHGTVIHMKKTKLSPLNNE